jgi:hypothetical protein
VCQYPPKFAQLHHASKPTGCCFTLYIRMPNYTPK